MCPDPAPPAAEQPVLTARHQRARAHLDVATGRGLEVGPLFSPIVRRAEGDVRYVDVSSTADLREHFREDPNVSVADIEEVDYVLQDGDRMLGLAEATADGAPFDWVVASHVTEHIPDLIGWLGELAEITVDAGRLALVIPDRRFCFDVHRPGTTVGAMLQAHADGDRRPSVRAIFDHFDAHHEASAADLWRGVLPGPEARPYTTLQAMGLLDEAAAGAYIDSHVWLFTPTTFVRQLEVLSEVGLLDWTIEDVLPTPPGELEFYVTLQRVPRARSDADARVQFQAELRRLEPVLAAHERDVEQATGTRPPAAPGFVVSERERRLVETKRRLALGLRQQTARVRARVRSAR